MKAVISFLFASAFAIAAVHPVHAADAPARINNVVLVHGAFADGSGWRKVYDILVKDGYHVSIVQQPMTSLQDDVKATQRVIDAQDGPVVLVGHSYGGAIITDAGADPKVKTLVYVAAIQPDVGESLLSLVQMMKAPNEDIQQNADGFLYLNQEKFAADFAADLPKADSAFMAAAQMPAALAAFAAPTKVASWHDKPSYAIVATGDRALNPDLLRSLYRRSSTKVTELKGSHAIFISKPREVAKVIEAAANHQN
jgi:pimeloyl-ACP methyl ester carboxylesterase